MIKNANSKFDDYSMFPEIRPILLHWGLKKYYKWEWQLKWGWKWKLKWELKWGWKWEWEWEWESKLRIEL